MLWSDLGVCLGPADIFMHCYTCFVRRFVFLALFSTCVVRILVVLVGLLVFSLLPLEARIKGRFSIVSFDSR